MPKYWLTLDGHKVREIKTSTSLTDCQKEAVIYEYAKENGLNNFGIKGVKIRLDRVQTQQDMPIYKLRQG